MLLSTWNNAKACLIPGDIQGQARLGSIQSKDVLSHFLDYWGMYLGIDSTLTVPGIESFAFRLSYNL